MFKGSANSQDQYAIDPAHGLWNQNVDFVLGSGGESVQVQTRRGSAEVFQIPSGDHSIPSLASWYFVTFGTQDCYAIYYSPSVGVKALSQFNSVFTSVLINVTGATTAVFVFDGTRAYVAFIDSTGRRGFVGGQVYGLSIGNDPLFAAPLQTSTVGVTITQPGAGVITAGTHRIGYVFTTRNGYVGALCPVDANSVFQPQSFTAADGVHNCNVAFNFVSVPSYLVPGSNSALIQVVMTSAANPARYFLVPNATVSPPNVPATVNITFSITDNDLVAAPDVTLYQSKLACSVSGTAPFKPSAIFSYSSRMGYVTLDAAQFPVVYFSDQNAFQSLTAAFHGIYLENRQIPVQGASLGAVCYIATLAALYGVKDNNGLPSTWIPPARVDGSVGILAASCMISSGGRIILASEKGLFVYRGAAFPSIPLSYWQTNDWNRINWANAWQVQIVDDAFERVIRVLAPLNVVITGASNTNPITITTAVLINGVPVAYPHLMQTGLSVTITGVAGNTNANTTQNITVTSANTFTIPVAGNGTYAGGGLVTPNAPNAMMTWNYSQGDEPGQAFYAIHAFTSYRAASMAIVRNLITNVDETWFSPQQSNPGNLVRRKLATDTLPFRDVDLSGTAAAINSFPNETSLLPGSQDETITVHDYHGAHFRVSGSGSLSLACYGLDHVRSVIPLASPLTLSQIPGIEVLVKWALRSEQQSIQFGTNAIDAYFVMALIRAYYTNSLPIR